MIDASRSRDLTAETFDETGSMSCCATCCPSPLILKRRLTNVLYRHFIKDQLKLTTGTG